MSALLRPWTERIMQVVDSGITEREAIIDATMAFVPQGHAYRVREHESARSLERARAAGIPQGKRREVTAIQVHRSGARRVIARTLVSLCRCGRLVRDGHHYRRPT